MASLPISPPTLSPVMRPTMLTIVASLLVVSQLPHSHAFLQPLLPRSAFRYKSISSSNNYEHLTTLSSKSDPDIREMVESAASTFSEPVKVEMEVEMEVEESEESVRDAQFMRQAIAYAGGCGGERGMASPFPDPIGSAMLVSADGRILGKGFSTFAQNCVQAALADAGIVATPLREWCVGWPSEKSVRDDVGGATLYLTMEPSAERKGSSLPPITQLIIASNIQRVVIGTQDPIPEQATKGAEALHADGLSVTMGVEQDAAQELITAYTAKVNSKMMRQARKHFGRTGRPLGLLHCSVIESDDKAAFARNGNAFGKDFGSGQLLSERSFGSYELAPPPESIWALPSVVEEDVDEDYDDSFAMDFEDEYVQEDIGSNPMMPWYEQVDAVIATFPRFGNGPPDNPSLEARLKGLSWLATQGSDLPPGVERVLVMDAPDLASLPVNNDDPNLPPGVDVEAFWSAMGRKKTRVLLRRSANALASQAAQAAAEAAKLAAEAAYAAKEAIESGDGELAAESAMKAQEAALTATTYLQKEVQVMLDLKEKLTSKGVIVESLAGGEPIDVMNHLGSRSGHKSVVWRAGCWGERGVRAMLDGAFQWVSSHLAVDATGGKFWQMMLAERCVQAACGPEQKVKIFTQSEDLSLEYCDNYDADKDCVMTVDGRPVRHVRLDCRIGLVDENRKRELVPLRTRPMKKAFGELEEAPWFL